MYITQILCAYDVLHDGANGPFAVAVMVELAQLWLTIFSGLTCAKDRTI